MEITLSTVQRWTHVWPSHDGLELMRYRSACRLHLTLKVYNFCNMSKVNEEQREREREKMLAIETDGDGRRRDSRTTGDNYIENVSNPSNFYFSSRLSFAPASSACAIWLHCMCKCTTCICCCVSILGNIISSSA